MKWCAVALLLAGSAAAAELPENGPEDPRIRTLVYDPDQVVVIKGHFGYQQMIQLGEGEQIESLSLGDSISWQVVPNKAKNLLFIKPVEHKAHTNLAVTTNRHSYAFDLIATDMLADIPALNYVVRFRYPQDEDAKLQAQLAAAAHDRQQEVVPDKKVDPSAWNLDYTFQGNLALAPLHVFDDGTFTYFQFRDKQDVPAIFQVTDGKNESLLNYHLSGKYVVVERTARQYTLRSREGVVCVYNEAAFRAAAAPAAQSPAPDQPPATGR
ncbi:MAG: P-type conjugative transfer protein VirB9 [Nevskia sp.]|nr:P-type conjugative transfer protein VirB9 [Nevskia sp.]